MSWTSEADNLGSAAEQEIAAIERSHEKTLEKLGRVIEAREAKILELQQAASKVWVLSVEDTERLADALTWAAGQANPVTLVIDGGVKVDVGDENGYLGPFGSPEQES